MDEKKVKKVTRFMTNSMGITVSIALGITMTILSGHFTLATCAMSLGISLVIALLIGNIIPIKKISDFVTKGIFSQFLTAVVSNFVINLFFAPIITACVCFAMTNFASKGIDKQIEGVKTQIEILQNENVEMNEVKIEELNNQIESMNNAKPVFKDIILKELLISFIISYVVTIIVQPIFLKIARNKYVYAIEKKKE